MSLESAYKELASAKRALGQMQAAPSFEIFEEEWRDFLNCLEKVWVKAERGCQQFRNKFEPWQGRYTAMRRKDMLLRYLKQARDADNHSIQEVAEIKPAHTTMNFANSGGGYIERMEIRNGKIVHYEGDPMIVESHPPTVEAVRVKNHGKWFNPPTQHLGDRVESTHPAHVGELGIAFYEVFLHEAEKTFFEPKL